MYLDLQKVTDYPSYFEKQKFFNAVLARNFFEFMTTIANKFGGGWDVLDGFSNPGFHIFPPHKTGSYFFGRMHEDIQWMNFKALETGWDLTAESQFSFTYVLRLPQAGGGLFVSNEGNYYPYEENALYIHSGQFLHAIAPTPGPMLPYDYRITLQGHGFHAGGKSYLYW